MLMLLYMDIDIPNQNFKNKIILCEIKVLARFFKNKELKEMIEMLKTLNKNPEVERIIKKYGQGFDSIYFDGKADGFQEGCNDTKIEVAKNLLNDGFDVEIISRNTGLSIDKIKNLKREL